jgi:murein DD-endopeptidase MepM/ murein hydrolase activator NlpD
MSKMLKKMWVMFLVASLATQPLASFADFTWPSSNGAVVEADGDTIQFRWERTGDEEFIKIKYYEGSSKNDLSLFAFQQFENPDGVEFGPSEYYHDFSHDEIEPGKWIKISVYTGDYQVERTFEIEGGDSEPIPTPVSDDEDPNVYIDSIDEDDLSIGDLINIHIEASDNVGVDRIELEVNGQSVKTTDDDTLDYELRLEEEKTTIKAYAYDEAGNKDSDRLTIRIEKREDKESPRVDIKDIDASELEVGDLINIHIVASDNVGVDRIELEVNGQSVKKTDDDTLDYELHLEGEKTTIKAYAYDQAGNSNSYETTVRVEKPEPEDTKSPSVDIQNIDTSGLEVGDLINIHIVASDNVGVDRIELEVNGKKVETTYDDTLNYKMLIVDEKTWINAYAYDEAGNSDSYGLMITLDERDNENPEVSVTINPLINLFVGDQVVIDASATDNVAIKNIQLKINGQTVKIQDGDQLAYNLFLEEEETEVELIVYDTSNNKTTYTNTIVADRAIEDEEDPEVDIEYSTDGDDVYIEVSAWDNVGVDRIKVYVDGKRVRSSSGDTCSYSFELGDDTVEVKAVAYDESNNDSEKKITIRPAADDEDPVVKIDTIADFKEGETIIINATASDNRDVSYMEVFIDDKRVKKSNGNKIQYDWSPASGYYEIKVVAYDISGNEGSKETDVSVHSSGEWTSSTWSELLISTMLSEGKIPEDFAWDYSRNITREEFVELVVHDFQKVRNRGINTSGIQHFQDTTSEAMLIAKAIGVINGDTSNRVRPTDSLTREEAVVMFGRYIEFVNGLELVNSGQSTFKDFNQVSSWAQQYVKFAERNTLIQGRQGKFYPKQSISIEEVLAVLHKVQNHEGQQYIMVDPYVNQSDFYQSYLTKWRRTKEFGEDNHLGLDIVNDKELIIPALADGVVQDVGYNSGGNGNALVLRHDMMINGRSVTFYSLYGHMKYLSTLKVGQKVCVGDPIGIMGNTGKSTGPHLHLGVNQGKATIQNFGYNKKEGVTSNFYNDYAGRRNFNPVLVIETEGQVILDNNWD